MQNPRCDVSLTERIARLEERFLAADKALDLARSTLSRNSVVTVLTTLVAVAALIVGLIKH